MSRCLQSRYWRWKSASTPQMSCIWSPRNSSATPRARPSGEAQGRRGRYGPRALSSRPRAGGVMMEMRRPVFRLTCSPGSRSMAAQSTPAARLLEACIFVSPSVPPKTVLSLYVNGRVDFSLPSVAVALGREIVAVRDEVVSIPGLQFSSANEYPSFDARNLADEGTMSVLKSIIAGWLALDRQRNCDSRYRDSR